MRVTDWSRLTETQKTALLERPVSLTNREVRETVKNIVDDVFTERDAALHRYRQRYDKVEPDLPLRLGASCIQAACNRVDSKTKQAIMTARDNIRAFHEKQLSDDIVVETVPGVVCQQRSHPVESVGLYIPAGTAPLPSSVLMMGVPAMLAGCKRVVLCSPPPVSDEIILAATVCDIHEIYAVGGAHAIAAMAFGTESIARVNKIFGPGNAYVTEAKQQVSTHHDGAAIDMPAGPSELLVIADQSANPEFVAADLLSQAEHSQDAQVVLVAPGESVISAVIAAINRQKTRLSRQKEITSALQGSRFILCESLEEAIAISNRYAPEHLSIQTENAETLAEKARNAGSVFVGSWSPESAGDYASGTNHVLPTAGFARVCSGLGVTDFMRRYTVQKLTPAGLTTLGDTLCRFADIEGLQAHGKAVEIRLNYLRGSVNKKEQEGGL